MKRISKHQWSASNLLTIAMVVIGMAVAFWVGRQSAANSSQARDMRHLQSMLMKSVSNNYDSIRSNNMSFTTATLDDTQRSEALYILDHWTGKLYCWIVNPQNGTLIAPFIADAAVDLGIDPGAESDFLMTSGFMDFNLQRTGNVRAANSVIYIAEGNTGKIVGYTLMYNRQNILGGGQQAGQLRLLFQQQTRGNIIRRQ